MKAECVVCGTKPDDNNWAEFDYISGDFYCPECNPVEEEFSEEECELCERTEVELTDHHLVPQVQGGSDEEDNISRLCVSCHRKVHATFSNFELEHKFNTIEKLRRQQEIRSYIAWITRTDKKNVKFKESNRAKYL